MSGPTEWAIAVPDLLDERDPRPRIDAWGHRWTRADLGWIRDDEPVFFPTLAQGVAHYRVTLVSVLLDEPCGVHTPIAYWCVARAPWGEVLNFRPWAPASVEALKTATIHHAAGCCICGATFEGNHRCPGPEKCNPEHPCKGWLDVQKWARWHVEWKWWDE